MPFRAAGSCVSSWDSGCLAIGYRLQSGVSLVLHLGCFVTLDGVLIHHVFVLLCMPPLCESLQDSAPALPIN
jgi:hypothetical protein